MSKKAPEEATPAPRKMPLREWAQQNGQSEIVARTLELVYKATERKSADGWEAAWYRLRNREV